MRLYSIMRDFIETADCLNLKYFTEKYHVSKRTIQGDLSYFMNIGERNGFKLHTIRGKGYLLEVTDSEKFDRFVAQLAQQHPTVPPDTPENLTAFLAVQKDYISMEETAFHFHINRSAVKALIKEVETFCRKYDVVLEIKSHYGLRLKKDNLAFTTMLAEMLEADNPVLKLYMEQSLPVFRTIYPFLIDQITESRQQINYNELKTIYIWLGAIALQASLLCLPEERYRVKNTPVDRIADAVFQQLNKNAGLNFAAWQYEVFVDVVRSNIRLKDASLDISDQLENHIEEFLKGIDARYNTKFTDDENFKKMLSEHVCLLVSRSHQKVSYKNSMLHEICIRYPLVFSVAIEFSNMLQQLYGITVTQDEAAFIATHFAGHLEKEKREKLMRFDRVAVVCSSGGGCAYLLKMQLETIFPQQKIQTFSFLNMDELELFDPDIIFTIMPLNREFNIPIIYIHELLEPEDLAAIRQFLSYDCIQNFQLSDTSSKFDALFSRRYFQVRKAGSYKELISEMADQLIKDDVVEAEYKDSVLEREKYMSTVFFNGVALPHPIKLCAKKSVISVCILDTPLMEQGKEVRTVFLISLRKDEYGKYEEITKLFYKLMQDRGSASHMVAARSFEQMRLILREVEATVS